MAHNLPGESLAYEYRGGALKAMEALDSPLHWETAAPVGGYSSGCR